MGPAKAGLRARLQAAIPRPEGLVLEPAVVVNLIKKSLMTVSNHGYHCTNNILGGAFTLLAKYRLLVSGVGEKTGLPYRVVYPGGLGVRSPGWQQPW